MRQTTLNLKQLQRSTRSKPGVRAYIQSMFYICMYAYVAQTLEVASRPHTKPGTGQLAIEA